MKIAYFRDNEHTRERELIDDDGTVLMYLPEEFILRPGEYSDEERFEGWRTNMTLNDIAAIPWGGLHV